MYLIEYIIHSELSIQARSIDKLVLLGIVSSIGNHRLWHYYITKRLEKSHSFTLQAGVEESDGILFTYANCRKKICFK